MRPTVKNGNGFRLDLFSKAKEVRQNGLHFVVLLVSDRESAVIEIDLGLEFELLLKAAKKRLPLLDYGLYEGVEIRLLDAPNEIRLEAVEVKVAITGVVGKLFEEAKLKKVFQSVWGADENGMVALLIFVVIGIVLLLDDGVVVVAGVVKVVVVLFLAGGEEEHAFDAVESLLAVLAVHVHYHPYINRDPTLVQSHQF